MFFFSFLNQIRQQISRMVRLQSLNEIFRGYEERTGTKLDVTYRTVDSLRAKLKENPYDFDAYLHIIWATDGVVGEPDNGLFPEWNPTKVIDILAPRA